MMNEELRIMNGGTCRSFLKEGCLSFIRNSSLLVHHSTRRAFTLIEMLIVIGIISILVGVSLTSFNKMMKSADKSKAQELVSNTATALTALFEADGVWPKAIRDSMNGDGKLDADAALILGKRRYMSLMVVDNKLAGKDRFGIVSPWALKTIETKGTKASLTTPVSGGGTIDDHVLRFAVDLDGDGIIPKARVGGESVDIRATAAVWCCGKDGKIESYSEGLRKDDVYSWTKGQTQSIK